MAAARQNEMNESATVVATTTFAVEPSFDPSGDGTDCASDMFSDAHYSTIRGAMATSGRSLAERIVTELRAAGNRPTWSAVVCAICCWGIQPKDYDVATDAVPDELLNLYPGATTGRRAFRGHSGARGRCNCRGRHFPQ